MPSVALFQFQQLLLSFEGIADLPVIDLFSNVLWCQENIPPVWSDVIPPWKVSNKCQGLSASKPFSTTLEEAPLMSGISEVNCACPRAMLQHLKKYFKVPICTFAEY